VEQLLTDIIGILSAVGPEVVLFVTLVEAAFFIGLLGPTDSTVSACRAAIRSATETVAEPSASASTPADRQPGEPKPPFLD
jgi:hypothetical protein